MLYPNLLFSSIDDFSLPFSAYTNRTGNSITSPHSVQYSVINLFVDKANAETSGFELNAAIALANLT